MTAIRGGFSLFTAAARVQHGSGIFIRSLKQFTSSLLSGSDATIITGTAGTSGDMAEWNADGDLVDGPSPTGVDDNYVTGTAGTSGNLSTWNGDGDLVDGPTLSRVVKASAETVNNSTTLQNDDELLLAVAANTNYWFWLHLRITSPTANPGLKLGWSVPASATMSWDQPETSTVELTESDADTTGTSSSNDAEHWTGIINTAGTAGNLQLQWAQNSATAENTQVLADSFLILMEL